MLGKRKKKLNNNYVMKLKKRSYFIILASLHYKK